MGVVSQSPLAMLLLVTPYTIIYLLNQLVLQGALDTMHFVFFEFIFIFAFRKVFGLPDLGERLFPAQVAIESAGTVRPLKTSIAGPSGSDDGSTTGTKKKVKKVIRKTPDAGSGSSPSGNTPPIPVKKIKKEQPYARELAAMEKKFMDYLDNKEIWEKVYEEDTRGLIEVYQYKARPMCYKVIAVMNNTPAATFDVMSEIERRVEWDPLCEEARTVASICPGVKVQYMRTKAIWPTASRDTVVLGTIKKLGEDSFFNVTTSVEHHLMPPRTKEKYVRMDTAVAGQVFLPEPGHPNKCRVIQVLDADLKGWIPEKVIQMVSTKSVPAGMRRVNKLLPSVESYTESKLLKRVEDLKKAAEEQQQNGGDDVAEESEDTSSHELNSKHGSDLPGHLDDGSRASGPGSLERKRPSTFRTFWRSITQTVGYSDTPIKANKLVVAAFVLAVLGPTIARYRRQRR